MLLACTPGAFRVVGSQAWSGHIFFGQIGQVRGEDHAIGNGGLTNANRCKKILVLSCHVPSSGFTQNLLA
jgi:hypothetical protein